MVTRIETETSPASVTEKPQIDLNRADVKALTTLPGIGPVLAQRIVTHRDEHGPFLFESDIQQVPGIGDTLYEDIADRLTLTLVPDLEEDLGGSENAEKEPGNGTAPEFDPTRVAALQIEEDLEEAPSELESTIEPVSPMTPPPLPAAPPTTSALPMDKSAEEELEGEKDQPDEDADFTLQAETDEEDRTSETTLLTPETETEQEEGDIASEKTSEREPAARPRRSGWLWSVVLGGILGALLGVGLMLLIFAAINGAIDINASHAMSQMRGQLNTLNTELDAIQGDVSTLQGDVGGLRERVQVLSGLTARMEQAEESLDGVTVEMQALEDETAALSSSLDTLSSDVEGMGETLNAVEEQTQKSTTFFEGLQELMREIFGQPIEPQGAAPQAIEEVDA